MAMKTLSEARKTGDIEGFIAEREAEGQSPGDAGKLNRVVKRLTETPKVVLRASRRAASGD
jgi:hypothetical protein